jgi:dipeptidyl-peptidase-3
MKIVSAIDESFLKVQDVLWQKRETRHLFVQPNTRIVDGEVVLVDYEESCAGVIRSRGECEL